MSPRYLLIWGNDRAPIEMLVPLLVQRTGLAVRVGSHSFAGLLSEECRYYSLGERGVVVGTLFDRNGPPWPLARLDEGDVGAILASRGERLLRSFWGGYVAAFTGANGARLLRDPSGALPCYLGRGAGCTVAASDVDLLIESGLARSAVGGQALASHFYRAGLPRAETVLDGIDELLPGFALDPGDETKRQQPCWSPWDHVRPASLPNLAEAVERVRRTVRYCVRALTADRGRVLVSVSGGLDSSIVAACLAGGRSEAICLTMFGEDPSGDERQYARALCEHLHLLLVERPYRIEAVDIEASLSAHLPRPIGRSQAHAYERAHVEAARDISADAFVTGNGGDNVFAYSQSAAAISDRFLSEGLGRGVIATLRDVGRQTGCNPLEAALAATRIARSPATYRWRGSPTFLHGDMLAELAEDRLEHPWLEAPPQALPGKIGHIAALLRVQQNLEPGRARHAPVINPLLAQPLMETCLAIPSWLWRCGGFDRSVARTAFARDLPALVTKRRTKGGPDGFAAELIAHHRPRVRERLLDGHLADQRLLDRPAVERALENGSALHGEEQVRVLEFLAAEAWLDHWLPRLAAGNEAAFRLSDSQCDSSVCRAGEDERSPRSQ